MKARFILVTLCLLIIGGFIVRLYDLKEPLADWHSWRQADTASVSREYLKHGIDLLHPTYQDLSSLPSGLPNPQGYRMVEFPLINGFVAWLYQTISPLRTLELHVTYRLVDIIFSLISAVFLYLLVRRLESPFTGLIATGMFLFLPYNIFYSRTILPEVAMVTFILATLYFGVRYCDERKLIDGILTTILAAIALLVKPVAGFFFLPLLPYLISRQGFKKVISLKHIVFLLIALGPLVWWRHWIAQYPAGIPASDWLLNGNGIRFKGAFFNWIFADRLGRLILGYWGIVFVALGLLARKKTNFMVWWLIGTLGYVIVFATGNVQHDYYQIPTIPIIAVLIGYGIQYMRRLNAGFFARYGLIGVTALFMFAFAWYQVRGYFNINNPAIVHAGQAVDRLTPSNAEVIAPYNGDTAFLYQTNRRGWPIGGDIDTKIKAGAGYYVSPVQDDETKSLMQKYSVVTETPEYVLINLHELQTH